MVPLALRDCMDAVLVLPNLSFHVSVNANIPVFKLDMLFRLASKLQVCTLFLPLIPHLSFRLLLRSSEAGPQLRAEEYSISFPNRPFSSILLVLPPNLLRLISLSIFPIGKVSSIALPDFSSILVFPANSLMCYCACFDIGGSIRCDSAPTSIMTTWNTWRHHRYAQLIVFIRHAQFFETLNPSPLLPSNVLI